MSRPQLGMDGQHQKRHHGEEGKGQSRRNLCAHEHAVVGAVRFSHSDVQDDQGGPKRKKQHEKKR